jgi:hypothetical protein
MSRRVKLPGADELFRPTKNELDIADGRSDDGSDEAAQPRSTRLTAVPVDESPSTPGPSGRVRHDEKITVYVTADELLELEHTRLTLRRDHGLAVDRGRIVREAIHLALAGVEHDGADSALVRRLQES